MTAESTAREGALSSLLKQAREKAGWTQIELAQRADVSPSVVQKTEAGGPYRIGRKASEHILTALREALSSDVLADLESAIAERPARTNAPDTSSESQSRWATVGEVLARPDVFSVVATAAEREWDRLSPDDRPGDRRRLCEHLLAVSGLVNPSVAIPTSIEPIWLDVVSSDRPQFVRWIRAYTGIEDRCAISVSLSTWFVPANLARVLHDATYKKGRPSTASATVLIPDWIPDDLKDRVGYMRTRLEE